MYSWPKSIQAERKKKSEWQQTSSCLDKERFIDGRATLDFCVRT